MMIQKLTAFARSSRFCDIDLDILGGVFENPMIPHTEPFFGAGRQPAIRPPQPEADCFERCYE